LGDAKRIVVAPVDRKAADACVERWHYSGRTYTKSRLHLGVWFDGELFGAMQFGPPLQTSHLVGLVRDTKWNGFIELNRMAFSERLPRNSESRALSVAMRMMRQHAPHVEWCVSFADGTQCGDGAIYRASGFLLTGIKRNTSLWRTPKGDVVSDVGVRTSERLRRSIGTDGSTQSLRAAGCSPLAGFQLRYVYPIAHDVRERLTVPVLPYSAIDAAGARMYRGERLSRAGTSTRDGAPVEVGGATPTPALQ
jgi:hypothetical protein